MPLHEIINGLAKLKFASMLDTNQEYWPVIGPDGAIIGLAVSNGRIVYPLRGPLEAPIGKEAETTIHMETMECDLYEECWNIKTERGVLFYAWELTDARRRGLEKAAHESGRVVRRTKTWARLIGEEIIRLHELQDKIRAALRSLAGGE